LPHQQPVQQEPRWSPQQPVRQELADDHVVYAVPGGALINRLFVARDVEKIFAFRSEKLREIFGQTG
jgi:hypothetical protein